MKIPLSWLKHYYCVFQLQNILISKRGSETVLRHPVPTRDHFLYAKIYYWDPKVWNAGHSLGRNMTCVISGGAYLFHSPTNRLLMFASFAVTDNNYFICRTGQNWDKHGVYIQTRSSAVAEIVRRHILFTSVVSHKSATQNLPSCHFMSDTIYIVFNKRSKIFVTSSYLDELHKNPYK